MVRSVFHDGEYKKDLIFPRFCEKAFSIEGWKKKVFPVEVKKSAELFLFFLALHVVNVCPENSQHTHGNISLDRFSSMHDPILLIYLNGHTSCHFVGASNLCLKLIASGNYAPNSVCFFSPLRYPQPWALDPEESLPARTYAYGKKARTHEKKAYTSEKGALTYRKKCTQGLNPRQLD